LHSRHNNDTFWVIGLIGAVIFFYWIIGVIVVGLIWCLWANTSSKLAHTIIVLLGLFFLLLLIAD